MKTKHMIALLAVAVSAAVGAFAEDDRAWVDSAIARFGTNYTVLAENAKLGYTKEAPYPKTFRNGKVVFCKDWDWCSGFFQGCLWYLHEATGDAKWRELAEKYTEEQAHIRTSNLHHDLGFLKLSKICPDKEKAARYRAEAVKIAKSLSSDAYFAKPAEIGGFVLKHAVASKPDGADIDVPLNYGDYYYLELLMELRRE